jgi:uncharacterized membrane protein
MRHLMLALGGALALISCDAPPAQPVVQERTDNADARRDPWSDARARGVDLRAIGQEPGWYLEIDHGTSMRVVYDYAERQASLPAPEPVTSGRTTTYDAETSEHRVRVIVDERPCSDVMSGEAFPCTVTVEIDGRTLRGCGRPL